jgi:flagellar assembly protein FliH
MATIISSDRLERHNVDKYNFKVLSMQQQTSSNPKENFSGYTKDNHPSMRESDKEKDGNEMSSSSKDSLIESLMQKTDEMSSNFIKLQMKLEEKEEEFAKKLQKEKEEAYNQGLEDAKKQLQSATKTEESSAIEQLSLSVKKLETSALEYESALEKIKSELVVAALDIAKEVVTKEISKEGEEIAYNLSKELIEELQEASQITIKVNPKHHGYISEKLGVTQKVNVVSDSAISEGGVIVMSDVGNKDAQIEKRFERVKKAALGV